MFRVVICDDDLFMLERMKSIIQKEMVLLGVDVDIIPIHNAKDKRLFELEADIYFLDIDMPEINGIELAKNLQALFSTIIVFITNRDELVYDSFEASPFRFIRKSVFESTIGRVVYDAIERLKRKQMYLVVEINREITRIPQRNIIYMDKRINTIYIYTTKGKMYRVHETISKIEEKLNMSSFLKVYPSILVNMEYIIDFKKDSIQMLNCISLPISRRLKEKARIKYMTYLSGK